MCATPAAARDTFRNVADQALVHNASWTGDRRVAHDHAGSRRGGQIVRVSETIAALFITLLGITTVTLARQLPYEAEYGPGPGFLPFWLGVTFVILSVFLLRDALKLRV